MPGIYVAFVLALVSVSLAGLCRKCYELLIVTLRNEAVNRGEASRKCQNVDIRNDYTKEDIMETKASMIDDIDEGKHKYSEKNPSQCHFIDYKSHTDCPGIETGPTC